MLSVVLRYDSVKCFDGGLDKIEDNHTAKILAPGYSNCGRRFANQRLSI